MRSFPRRIATACTAGMLATAVFTGAVTAAPVAQAQTKSKSTSSTDSTLSSDVGSSEVQSFYDKSPEWGQLLLALIAGGLLLESFGFLVGPLRLSAQQIFKF